jgi:hypothetical protein
MKSPSVTPTIASARSNQSSSPSKRSRNTFMRRSRRLRLKRQRRFSSTWSLNPPKRSLRSAPNCIWRSPTGERGSTKTWPRLVLIPSQSPAAPTGSPTSDRPRLMRSPRKSVPEASKSDSGAFGSTLPVGGMSRALGLAAVSKPPLGHPFVASGHSNGKIGVQICPSCKARCEKKALKTASKDRRGPLRGPNSML